MGKYMIIDNRGGTHFKEADSDEQMLEFMKTRYVDYIYSVLSSDSIVVFRPNGYLLAYINTATGCQNVKTMADWGVSA